MSLKLTTAQIDRAAGVLLGMACGDALGAGYEFGPPLGADVEVRMAGGGSCGWAPGEWTDDTSMAIASPRSPPRAATSGWWSRRTGSPHVGPSGAKTPKMSASRPRTSSTRPPERPGLVASTSPKPETSKRPQLRSTDVPERRPATGL